MELGWGTRDEVRWVGREPSRPRKGTNRSPVTVVTATGAVQVVVPSLWICLTVASGLTGWRSRAYRKQVELSMAAAACLRWAQIASGDRKAVHSGVNTSYSWAHGDSQDGTPQYRFISGAPE